LAWIESHQDLGRHPKTKRLKRRLNISLPAVVGHLHYLWWWALDFAEDGDLSKYDAADIADAAMWEGEPEVWEAALIEAGFMDEDRTLHDWYEYAGRFIQLRKEASEAGAKGNHERWHVQRGIIDPDCPLCQEPIGSESPNDRVSIGGRSGSDRVGVGSDRTLTLTLTNTLTTKDSKTPSTPSPIYTDDFVAFWEAYPRRVEKRAALKAWTTTLKGRRGGEKPTPETLITCAKHYAAYCMGEQTEQRYIKHPSTFLGPSEPWRDWIEPRAAPTQETPVDRRLREAGVMF